MFHQPPIVVGGIFEESCECRRPITGCIKGVGHIGNPMFLKEKKDFDLLVVRVTALNWLETRWKLYDRGEMCLPGHFRGTFDACV